MLNRIIKEEINKYLLSEISHLAVNSQVTVCSLQDFQKILNELNVNQSNCSQFDGKYAFIEIGSGYDRIEKEYPISSVINDPSRFKDSRDFFEHGQFVLPSCDNVLHLIFDDIKSDVTDDEGYFTGRISKKNVIGNQDNSFKYKNPLLFNKQQAKETDNFINTQLEKNPNVKFIVHCLMGQSRSAAIGSYINEKIGHTHFNDFMKDYDIEGEDELGIRNSQFDHGINMKQYGHTKYPNKTVLDNLTKVGKLPKDWYQKRFNRYFNIPYFQRKYNTLIQSGNTEKANKLLKTIRKYYDNDEEFIKDFPQ